MRYAKFVAGLLCVLLFCTYVYAGSCEEYSLAIQALHSQDMDAAFMYFRSVAKDYPDSKYAKNALFATGEYYFLIADYYDAARMFFEYVNSYPESNAKLFAEAYLLSIARKQGQEDLTKELENSIKNTKQLVLLFKDSKVYKYKSPLLRVYRAEYYIDKVEFYVDGSMLAEISY